MIKMLHSLSLVLLGISSLTASSASGQLVAARSSAEAPASDCPLGVSVTFYDFRSGQAQYLSDQFPFIHGPGQLLDSLKVSEITTFSEINFAPEAVKSLGGNLRSNPQPWVRAPPVGFAGTVAILKSEVDVNQDGFWTFFLTSSSPVQFNLSQANGNTHILNSGSELETDGNKTYGTVQFVQYNLTRGLYDFVIEWHQGLPGQPQSEPMLVLEYSWTADKAKTPSPSVQSSPRTVVPADMLFIACEEAPAIPSVAPASGPAINPSSAPLPDVEVPSSGPLSPDSALPPNVMMLAAAAGDASCSAFYTLDGPWFDDENNTQNAVVTFYLRSREPIPVPFSVVMGGAFWKSAYNPFNMKLTTGYSPSGVFSGTVSEDWEQLGATNSVSIGATFTSDHTDLTPTVIMVNGEICTLEEA